MMSMRTLVRTALAVAIVLSPAACTTGTTTTVGVGVYGAPVYGPAPWGRYPYPGYYPPVGGGVWVGVCCEEEQQEAEQQDGDDDDRGDTSPESAPATDGPEGD